MTRLKPCTTFQTFRALLSNIWFRINKTLGVLTFLGHLVIVVVVVAEIVVVVVLVVLCGFLYPVLCSTYVMQW